MTMSDFYELQPVSKLAADTLSADANKTFTDLSAVPSTSSTSMSFEDLFGDDYDDVDQNRREEVPAKRARLENTTSAVAEWDMLLAGMDLPESIIPPHGDGDCADASKCSNDVEDKGRDEEMAKNQTKSEPKDCHDFYGELEWCDEIVAKVSAQLEKGREDEEERMIIEAEERALKVVEEFEMERARQKLLKKKNREAQKLLSKASKEKKLFCCFICNKGFLKEELVQEHVNEVHLRNNKTYPYKCPHCHMRFAHKPNLYRHQSTHQRDAFKCEQCPYEFKTEMGLQIHINRVHAEENVTYECEFCHTTYKHEEELKRHQYYCKNKDDILLKRKKAKEAAVARQAVSPAMSTCSFESSSLSTCSTSTGGRPTKDKSCPFCLDVFASMQSRNRHISRKHPEMAESEETKTHTYFKVDSPDLPFACNVCAKRFASCASMNVHKKRIHEKKLDHVCTICSKAYPLGSELRKHLRRVHQKTEVDAQDMTTF